MAKTLCIVVVVFIVTWTPFFIMVLISKYFPMNLSPGQMIYFAYFVKISQYASSACNPFIYAFRQREFTHALRSFWGGSTTTHHRRLNDSLAREIECSRASTKTTRSFFNRRSKGFEENEQLHLNRSHRISGQKKRSNGQHCSTHV